MALRVEPADDDAHTALENRAESLSDSPEREFQLGGIIVLLAEPVVPDLYELDDIGRIETVDTLEH